MEALTLELEVMPALFGDPLAVHCDTAPPPPLGAGGQISVEGHSPGELTKLPLVQRIFPSCAKAFVVVPKL